MFGLTDEKGNPYYHQQDTPQVGRSVTPIVNINNPDPKSGVVAGRTASPWYKFWDTNAGNSAYGADQTNFIGNHQSSLLKNPFYYINPALGVITNNKVGAFFKRRRLAKGFQNLDTTHGMTLSNDRGVDYQVSPETMDFVNRTRHIYSGSKDQVETNVRKDVADWIDKQGKFKQLTGIQGSFDNIQRDLNAWQQHAMWQLKNGTPEQKRQAQLNLQYIANAQYTLNKTIPEFNKARTATLNKYKQNIGSFVGNNWWWMLPAGGALLYGLGNLFGRGGQPMGQPAVPRPSYWKTGLQTPNTGQAPQQLQTPVAVPQPQ